MKRLSIVVPVFNEQDVVAELYERVKKTCEDKLAGYDWELLFVNDGSSDLTLSRLTDISFNDHHVSIINFTRNFGQHPAICAGLQHAQGDLVLLMDGDLQNPPEEMPKLLAKIEQGYDIVYGVREQRKDNIVRRSGSQFFHLLLRKILGLTIADVATAFRVLTRKAVNEFNTMSVQSRNPGILMAWMGFKSTTVQTQHHERGAGQSKYSYWKVAKMTVEMAMDFSPHLLRLITWFGLCISAVSFILGFYFMLMKALYAQVIPGFTAIVVLITFFFGTTFVLLGIVSEYIARLFQHSLRRPSYIVDAIIGGRSKTEYVVPSINHDTKEESRS